MSLSAPLPHSAPDHDADDGSVGTVPILLRDSGSAVISAANQLDDLVRRVAVVDSTVLITGESGSGKERVARMIHQRSARASEPFVAVNCGAIAETLLESELFGHARGAFTGATHDRPGLFEAASGGIILLDEVGEVPLSMQVKLLRVLQEHEIRRVGENHSRPVDVRVLAATNRNLVESISAGAFRQDLYYRLRVLEVHVPPLRRRRDDILPLATSLLAETASRMKRPVSGLSPAAIDLLLRYGWPGNVRELENAIESAVALARGSHIEPADFPSEIRGAPAEQPTSGEGSSPFVPAPVVRPLADVERDCILAALDLNGGNQTRTAKQLGIGHATLYRKLRSYGLPSHRRARAIAVPAAEGGCQPNALAPVAFIDPARQRPKP